LLGVERAALHFDRANDAEPDTLMQADCAINDNTLADGVGHSLLLAAPLAALSNHARVPVMKLRRSMEKCAATVRALHDRSHPTPSMSAEDCTAHRDSQLSWHGLLPRSEQGR
jgi:hypothetical protein